MTNIINETLAARANNINSFSDYKEGSATAEYNTVCNEVKQLGERCKATSYEPERIDYLVSSFCRKYAEWTNKYNANRASCPSVMICGASNFPNGKKQKQNNREDTLWNEYNEIMSIKDKIPTVGKTIKSDADNAIELLQAKLDKLTAKQNEMKETNAYYRKHKTLKGYKDLTEEVAAKIDAQLKDSYHNQPYASFSLTNNNATIKATTKRLEDLTAKKEKAQTTPTIETEIKGVKVVENLEADRLQLIFEGKPAEEVRSILKSNGFRWSPNNMAWQRQLTANAKWAAKQVLKAI